MAKLPISFVNQLKEDFPILADTILKSLNDAPPTSIRLNPFKKNKEYPKADKIAWTDDSYYLKERPAFYADPYFHSGSYYVQEASSMVIEYILKKLDLPDSNLMALDLCAAPGGKSTILSTFLKGRGLLVSNEIVWKRNLILQENIERWGQSNTIITHNNSHDFSKISSLFDIVLIDAPCSGEGMFRKDTKVINEWSEKNIELCCDRQSEILTDIRASIKENGYLIYSTCTYNLRENEEQIDTFLKDDDFECIEIPELEQLGIIPSRQGKALFYRLFPGKIKGEGLSVSILKRKIAPKRNSKKVKKGSEQGFELFESKSIHEFVDPSSNLSFLRRNMEVFAIEHSEPDEVLRSLQALRIIKFGTHIGDQIRKDFIPSHALALSNISNPEISQLDLDYADALRLLQKDATGIEIPDTSAKWLRLSHAHNDLAFAKVLGNRLNIHLPKTFRIRKNIDEFL